MRLVIDLTLPTEARLISTTRRVFAGYLEEIGVAPEITDDIVLAIAEACTNVMLHACPDSHCYNVSAELTSNEVVLVVEDDGVGLPPDLEEPRVVDLTATSGRGLNMIRQLMSSVDVESAPDRRGTRVEMRKSLNAPVLSNGSTV